MLQNSLNNFTHIWKNISVDYSIWASNNSVFPDLTQKWEQLNTYVCALIKEDVKVIGQFITCYFST